MLISDNNSDGFQFPEAMQRYLEELLHQRVDVRSVEPPRNLPSFIGRLYTFHEAHILGRRCLVVAGANDMSTPAEIAKHIGIVRKAVDTFVVFATNTISAYNRSRLIGHGIPFIVPGNQLYLPDLAIDLREHFRAPKQRQTEGLSPVAQVVLFHYLLQSGESATTPSLLASELQYSAMSIGRAFDDLVARGLAETVRQGKERHIRFKSEGGQLLEEAAPLLRSPVRSLKFVQGKALGPFLRLAGETALSRLTELASPRMPTFAVAASNWKDLARTAGLTEVDRQEADCTIETWSYDPAVLSDEEIVDALSLYAQFRDHEDERVAMAADQLLEHLPW